MVNKKHIQHGEFSLSYTSFGEGEKVVLCLHGHGKSAEDFLFLEGSDVRVVSVNLFFHDKSVFPEDRIEQNPVEWNEIQGVFEKLFEAEKMSSYHILAFSQGGRFAFLLLEHTPKRIETFTLLAPDGLNNQSFYNWSSRQKYFRKLTTTFGKHPEKLQKTAKVLTQMKMMRPKVRDLVYHFTAEKESLHRAFSSWMAFRKLKPNPIKIGESVRENHVSITLIMGKYDQVIRTKQAKIFFKNAGLPENIIEIENGHDFFKAGAVEKFIKFLPFLSDADKTDSE
ncbi:MAG: alpha/beta hydrolase [Crocinitomicaceae bacterium]|nr:alpha/beta hydrolase [Crocinitomicaceae bacterium]